MEEQRRTAGGGERGVRCGRIGRRVPFALLGLAVVVGLFAWGLIPGAQGRGDAAQHRGGARLAVDRDLIDFGQVRYGQYVEARFRLKNVGDQPLRLPPSPSIEVVEGC
jgi:hypothetical protein